MSKSYKTECPICHHYSLYVTEYNNMSYCFRASCHYFAIDGKQPIRERKRSENIQDIRELYKDITAYYHSCLDKTHVAYLIKRGFTLQTIDQFRIGYCPKGKNPKYKPAIAKEAGIATGNNEAFLEDRITFPYFKDEHTITDIRARTIDPYEELRYKSPFGGAYYRGALYPYNNHLVNKAKRIVITEGEIKADISYQTNVITIGLPGILAWRSGFIQRDDQEVIIVFDNERKVSTQKDIIYAIRKIASFIIQPKIAVLPFMGNEEKVEIDTFVNKYGAAIYKSILDNALSYEDWNKLQAW